MGSRRRVVRHIHRSSSEQLPVLHAIAARLCEGLVAKVVYAYTLGRDGSLHCIAVAPPDTPRHDELHPERHPDVMDILYAGSPVVLEDLPEGSLEPGHMCIAVPVWDEAGPRGLFFVVHEGKPSAGDLAMLAVLARAAGVAYAREVAHEKAAAQRDALERTVEALFRASEAVSLPVVLAELGGSIERANEAAQLLWGLTDEQLRGGATACIASEDLGAWQQLLLDTASRCEMRSVDLRLVHRSGALVWASAHASPLPGTDGTVERALVVLHPHPGSFADEPLLGAYLAPLIVRELASPMSAINGYAQLLSRSVIAEDVQARERIARGLAARCQEVSTLLEELALLAGIERAPALAPEVVDVGHVVRVAVSHMRADGSGDRIGDITVRGEGSALVDRVCLERSIHALVRCLARTYGNDAGLRCDIDGTGATVRLTIRVEPQIVEQEEMILAELASVAAHDGISQAGVGLHLARAVAEVHGGNVIVARSGDRAPSITVELPSASAS